MITTFDSHLNIQIDIKHKIRLVSDSHSHSISSLLFSKLGKYFDVLGYVRSGSGPRQVFNDSDVS